MSPTETAATGTSISPPSRSTRAAIRAQRHERPDRGGGVVLSARFQPFADHDERDHHGGGLEVKMCAGRPGKQQIEAVPVGTGCAERDQQVHIAGPGPERLPRRDIEARADDELDRRREGKLQPARQHDPDHWKQ